MHRYRLFAPGPTPVPPEVLAALAQPVVHHRTQAFAALFAEVRQNLRWLFQTEQEVLCLSGTGTAAMDAAVTNLLSPGDTALYVNGGKFGARWGTVLRAYGVTAVEVPVAWGQAVDPQAVATALQRHPAARAVYLQSCETSTATLHPVAEVAKVCHSHGDILCVVDAITALGVIDLGMDRDGLDVLISGSQKAMMLPPGLAFIALSERAWEHSRRAQLPRFYLDLARELTAARSNQTAWTASVSLVAALHVALQMMQAEGLQQIFKRHRLLADGCRAGLQALGCSLYSQAPAHGLTAALPPAGIDASEVVKDLQRRFNLTLVGGQDAAKGKIFRVAHMGYFDELDILTFLGALELSFAAQRPQGASASAGASAVGSTAAQAVFVAAV